METLKGPGSFTVFALTEDAFAAVPQEKMNALAADPEALLPGSHLSRRPGHGLVEHHHLHCENAEFTTKIG